jgi:hypothetical protein
VFDGDADGSVVEGASDGVLVGVEVVGSSVGALVGVEVVGDLVPMIGCLVGGVDGARVGGLVSTQQITWSGLGSPIVVI